MGKYTVRSGDTLSQLAKDNNITVNDLVKWNNISDPNRIYVGQQLNLSADGGSSTGGSNNAKTDNKFQYDPFQYDDYQESDIVTQAKNALDTHLAQKPGAYQSPWQQQLNDTIDKIMNREKFSYDLNGDALYQQYKDKYTRQAKMAMGDAIGQASAMTGGYGNSYAQSVGQQMYQKEMQNLNDIVPELYQMAYDRYNQEGQDLYNQYSLLGAQEDRDYGRYRDSVGDWQNERGYLADRYDSERTYDYGKYADDRTFNYGIYSGDRDLAYQEHRNAIDDALALDALEYQKERDRIEDEQWQKQFNAMYGDKTTEGSDDETVVGNTGGNPTENPVTPPKKEAPKEEDVDVNSDLNYLISKGASKSEINNYLRQALKSGYISNAEYQSLKNKYAPRGYTY